jgi:environmental stress-induced protein Ves
MSETFFFKGDDAVECELIKGPITDFNLMIKRGWGYGSMRWVLNPTGTAQDDYLFYYQSNLLIQLTCGEVYCLEGRYLEIRVNRTQQT